MKKLLLASSLAISLSTGALAQPLTDGQWYAGVEFGSGSGQRTYDSTTDANFDSTVTTLKVGKIDKNYDKLEFQYTAKHLENSNNSSDTDDISEYKVNFALSILKLSYKEIVIPYLEVGIGIANSDAYDTQFATHLGGGVMINPTNNIELSVGYRLSTNIGNTDNDVSYTDQHSDFIIGAAYKF